MLKEFFIDEQYVTEVTVRTETSLLDNPENPTHEDLIKIIKGHDKMVSISSKDHDEFTKLRNTLEEQGYIVTQRNWWNGDRVIKGFKLNGYPLKKGERFYCAAAMKGSFNMAKLYKNSRIGF
jgi:hypothetical protein